MGLQNGSYMKQDKARGSLHDATFSSTNRNGKQQDFIDPCSCTPFQVKSLRDHFLTKILHRCLTNCFFTLHLLFTISIWTFISLFHLDFYFPFSVWTFISLFYFGLLFHFSSFFQSDQIIPNQTKSDQI